MVGIAGMKTQAQMFYEAHDRLATRDRHVMEMLRHPTNPLTKADLQRLIERCPERWARYAGICANMPE
jgi:hypothetical protein